MKALCLQCYATPLITVLLVEEARQAKRQWPPLRPQALVAPLCNR